MRVLTSVNLSDNRASEPPYRPQLTSTEFPSPIRVGFPSGAIRAPRRTVTILALLAASILLSPTTALAQTKPSVSPNPVTEGTSVTAALATEVEDDMPPPVVPSTCPGDFDGNRRVEIADFLAFVDVFGSSSADANYNAQMDLDSNGRVEIADFLALQMSLVQCAVLVVRTRRVYFHKHFSMMEKPENIPYMCLSLMMEIQKFHSCSIFMDTVGLQTNT